MSNVQIKEVSVDEQGIRLDRWFARHYPNVSHNTIEKALRKGQIRVDSKRVKASLRLHKGQQIRVPPLKEVDKKISVKKNTPKIDATVIKKIQQSVIHKDEHILVLNKPAGIPVQGGTNIKVSINDLLPYLTFESSEPPKLVHRLDKNTTGLLLLARKTSTAAKLAELFRKKEIKKNYWAVVVGVPELKEGTVNAPLVKSVARSEKMIISDNGKKAITHFCVLERAGNTMALLSLNPETGRTHQLRAHMQHLGTPILSDGKYGGREAFIDGFDKIMHLHARELVVPGFQGGEYKFTADLPDHMMNTCKKMGFD